MARATRGGGAPAVLSWGMDPAFWSYRKVFVAELARWRGAAARETARERKQEREEGMVLLDAQGRPVVNVELVGVVVVEKRRANGRVDFRLDDGSAPKAAASAAEPLLALNCSAYERGEDAARKRRRQATAAAAAAEAAAATLAAKRPRLESGAEQEGDGTAGAQANTGADDSGSRAASSSTAVGDAGDTVVAVPQLLGKLCRVQGRLARLKLGVELRLIVSSVQVPLHPHEEILHWLDVVDHGRRIYDARPYEPHPVPVAAADSASGSHAEQAPRARTGTSAGTSASASAANCGGGEALPSESGSACACGSAAARALAYCKHIMSMSPVPFDPRLRFRRRLVNYLLAMQRARPGVPLILYFQQIRHDPKVDRFALDALLAAAPRAPPPPKTKATATAAVAAAVTMPGVAPPTRGTVGDTRRQQLTGHISELMVSTFRALQSDGVILPASPHMLSLLQQSHPDLELDHAALPAKPAHAAPPAPMQDTGAYILVDVDAVVVPELRRILTLLLPDACTNVRSGAEILDERLQNGSLRSTALLHFVPRPHVYNLCMKGLGILDAETRAHGHAGKDGKEGNEGGEGDKEQAEEVVEVGATAAPATPL